MINELTKEQKEKFNIYIEKWTKIGLSTNTPPDDVIEKEASEICSKILDRPLPVLIVDSPLAAWFAVSLLENIEVKDKVWDKIGIKVWTKVRAKVWDKVGDKVRTEVGAKVWAEVRDKVWTKVRAKVWTKVRDKVRTEVRVCIWPYIDGHFSANWFSFYEYMHNEFGVQYDDNYETYKKSLDFELIYPLDDICIVSRKPIEINLTKDELHADLKPAVLYADGFAIWSLNGVSVPQWLAETRDRDIDPCRIKEITNAQQRVEFVRKVGRERIAAKTVEKVLDEKTIILNTPIQNDWPCKYRLLRLNYGNNVIRTALEMQNPSLPEVWHIEYVPANLTTIEQAMNFRLKRKEETIDDENGEDFYIHGDRVLVPENAVKTKRWPKLIA